MSAGAQRDGLLLNPDDVRSILEPMVVAEGRTDSDCYTCSVIHVHTHTNAHNDNILKQNSL